MRGLSPSPRYDVEDYVCDAADEGTLCDARMLTELGVRGNFSLVGFYAQRWPRERNSKTPLSLSCPAMPAMRKATTTWRVAVFMADIIPNALSEK